MTATATRTDDFPVSAREAWLRSDARDEIATSREVIRQGDHPVAVVRQADGRYLASDALGITYGTGATDGEAVEDLLAAVTSLKRRLRTNEPALSPRLRRQLHSLEAMFPQR